MRIAMVSPYALTRPGGVQGQVLGLSRSLHRLRHEVTVIGPADGDGVWSPAAGPSSEIGERDVVVIGRPTGVRSNGSVAPVALSPMAAVLAVRAVRAGGFDVVHVHEPLAPVTSYGLVVQCRTPMVGTYHRAGVSRWLPVLKPLASLVGRRLQVRVAVSEAARETGERSGAGTFEVLFNGVDVGRFASAKPERTPGGEPIVFFVGRHEERKGLAILLAAFASLDLPAVLCIAGDGPETKMLRQRHPQTDRVRWLGVLDDEELARRLAGADVLCAPSLHGESFGVVLLEGLAAGCAVVASDIDGYRAAAGGLAALVPPGDADALARALGVALVDAVRGSGASSPEAHEAARAHARAWSMDALAERYLDVYREAIDRRRARRETLRR
jgi:phosphatidyl-myo-inositol alpha-mannosyltransferase